MSTPPLTFGEAIDAYIHDGQQFGRLNSRNSELRYRSVLRTHWRDVGRRSPRHTDRVDVKRTLEHWGGSSRYNAHAILTAFYDWLMQEGQRKDNPARMVAPTKRRTPTVYRLTRGEVAAMMDACETPRERRIIFIGLLTGSRVSELAQLQRRHFERPGWVWFSADIVKGGQHERWVPVLAELKPIIAELGEHEPSDAYVIPHLRGTRDSARPLSRCQLGKIVHKVGRRAGIVAQIHPHLLRHAFGDHVARHAGLKVAQALMGHGSVETTARVYVDRPALDELAGSVRGFRYRGAPDNAQDPAHLGPPIAPLPGVVARRPRRRPPAPPARPWWTSSPEAAAYARTLGIDTRE
jgi:integrase